MTDKIKQSLNFVVKYYRPGVLRPDTGFISASLPFWRRHAAAASIIGIALVAAAAVTTIVISSKEPQAAAPIEANPTMAPQTPDTLTLKTTDPTIVKKIEFENASLPEVIKAIEATYNVKVAGNAEGMPTLTLSYQGTANDLIATINDLLGTNLKIEE